VNERSCPRCHELMRTWDELSDEERDVVNRLPASAEYASDERVATHLWCTRCWYEETGGTEQRA